MISRSIILSSLNTYLSNALVRTGFNKERKFPDNWESDYNSKWKGLVKKKKGDQRHKRYRNDGFLLHSVSLVIDNRKTDKMWTQLAVSGW